MNNEVVIKIYCENSKLLNVKTYSVEYSTIRVCEPLTNDPIPAAEIQPDSEGMQVAKTCCICLLLVPVLLEDIFYLVL